MAVLKLLVRAKAIGFTIRAEGDVLIVSGPKSAAGLALEIANHKAEVIKILRFQEGRGSDRRNAPIPGPLYSQAEQQHPGKVEWDSDTIRSAAWLQGAELPTEFELYPQVRVLDSQVFKRTLLADLAAGPGGIVAGKAKDDLHHVYGLFHGRDDGNGE